MCFIHSDKNFLVRSSSHGCLRLHRRAALFTKAFIQYSPPLSITVLNTHVILSITGIIEEVRLSKCYAERDCIGFCLFVDESLLCNVGMLNVEAGTLLSVPTLSIRPHDILDRSGLTG